MCPTPPSPDWLPLATFAVQLGTLIGAAGVAAAALWQAGTARKRHEAQTTADRERRITESFAKAGEQLGSDKLEARLIAIYTLERISKQEESEREYWPIMETLTAFVRERAPWSRRQAGAHPFFELQSNAGGETTAGESPLAEQPHNKAVTVQLLERRASRVQPATDIQAVLTVLGRRDARSWKQDQAVGRWLDLADTDLEGAFLREAHLQGADIRGAHLQGAKLWDAHLEGADLRGAHLEGADLIAARLEGAGLSGATGLTQKQVHEAWGDEKTTLPDGLTRPAHWPAAAPPDNAE